MLPSRHGLTWPADLYLEGSDQHRGWFQSSLFVGLGTRGRPPFRQVLTHGFLIDLEGRKMSKSVGNAIQPQDVIKDSGAEILRLWVAMSDYREELRVSKEILTRVIEGVSEAAETPAGSSWPTCTTSIQRPTWCRSTIWRRSTATRFSRYADAAQRVIRGYDEYDFSTVFQALNTLATSDLSAFYIDVTKDRMYTFGARSRSRRSAQTVMYLIADGLARLLAPILSVTADELWRFTPGERSKSVHLEEFPDVDGFLDRDLMATWDRVMQVRDEVYAALEQKRKGKVIGNSLGARVAITATGSLGVLLEAHRADLPMLFIVSDVTLHVESTDGADSVRIEVEKAAGVKCERCWRYVPRVRREPDWAGICDRCVDALAETVPG